MAGRWPLARKGCPTSRLPEMKVTIERFTAWVFRHRLPLVIVFSLLTVVMGWFAAHLHVDASFNKGLPLDHPYIRTFTKYQSDFGGANRVIIALMAQQGDIFTPEFFKLLKQVTDDVFFLPGVDRAQVQSLFTPNVRYTEVVEDGFSGGNVIPPDFQPTPEGLARVPCRRGDFGGDRCWRRGDYHFGAREQPEGEGPVDLQSNGLGHPSHLLEQVPLQQGQQQHYALLPGERHSVCGCG